MKRLSIRLILLWVSMAFFTSCGILSKGGNDKISDEEKEKYRVVLTLKDGTVVDGYIRSSLNDCASSVKVSSGYNGALTTYKAADLVSLVYPATVSDPQDIVWRPVFLKRKFSAKKEKMSKSPVLLRVVDNGDNVTYYACKTISITQGGFNGNIRYYTLEVSEYYSVRGNDFAIPLAKYNPSWSEKVRKKYLETYFGEYPELGKHIQEAKSTADVLAALESILN